MIYIVLGYGIPKDIFESQNYNIYLRTVFNTIFDLSRNDAALIIFAGGKTNLVPPYNKSEGGEMRNFFQSLSNRDFLRHETERWKMIIEDDSISTLENLINSKELVKKNSSDMVVFCEITRLKRIKVLSKRIFSKPIKVFPIDFDNGSNRYLPCDFLDKKEKQELKMSLWALKNRNNYKKLHDIYEKKFKYFRKMKKTDPGLNFIKSWWEEQQNELMKICE